MKQWLEQHASPLPAVEIRKSYFVNTAIHAKARREEVALDPDGPRRTGLQVDPEDAEYDRILDRSIWGLLRRGRLPEAQKLAQKFNHPWKSAVLRSVTLFDDPNLHQGTFFVLVG